MANRYAAERVESAEAKPHGRAIAFPAASYKKREREDMRAQFERLLIFVLCALWGLGMTLWALTAVANSSFMRGAVSSSAAASHMAMPEVSAIGQLPITVARYVIGW